MKIRVVMSLLVILSFVAWQGSPPAHACSGSCYENAFGCVNPYQPCFDLATGCGTCQNLGPFGPCVCDPSRPPDPEPPSGGPLWGGEVDLDDPIDFGPLEFQPGGSSTGFPPVAQDAPLPEPQPGDRLCGDQRAAVTLIQRYNLPWGLAAADRITVEGTRFCAEMTGYVEDDPDWLAFRITTFDGLVPSFRPNALPAFETGDNRVRLDALPSRGKLHLPTGTIVAEVHAKLVNQLFRDSPVPLRAGLRGRLDLDRGMLVIERADLDAMTPPDYTGPVPQ